MFLRALRDRLLLPAERRGLEQRDERGRRRDEDTRRDPGLEQRRIVVERCAVDAVVAEEHDDELRRRLELLPVALLAEARHVLAHEPGVPCEVGAAQVVVRCVGSIEIRLERHLGVDDEVLAARVPDDEIRPEQASVVVAAARLLHEVAVGEHAGELDDALELHLAPPAAHVRCAQRGDEAAGLLSQQLLPLHDGAQVLVDRADGREALLLERLRLLLEAVERLGDRLQLRLGETEQRRRARLERIVRERLELLVPARVVSLGEREPLLGRCGQGALACQLGVVAAELAAGPEPAGDGAEDESEDESHDEHGQSRLEPGSDGTGFGAHKKSAPAGPKTYRS